MKICPYCKAEIEDSAACCPSCKKQLDVITENSKYGRKVMILNNRYIKSGLTRLITGTLVALALILAYYASENSWPQIIFIICLIFAVLSLSGLIASLVIRLKTKKKLDDLLENKSA